MPIIAAILSFLASWGARILGSAVIRIVIWKVLIWALLTSVLPIVLYNLLSYIIGQFFTLATTYLGNSGLSAFTYEFTGLGAWLAHRLKIIEAFSVVMTACIFRMTINLIPFIGKI